MTIGKLIQNYMAVENAQTSGFLRKELQRESKDNFFGAELDDRSKLSRTATDLTNN
jgi:hypothetical protein